jgi:hypothetical protein
MIKSNWKDIAELVGIAAIVASLLFVGLELRQSQEIALSEAYQQRAAIEISNASAIATVPGYMSGLAKLYDGASSDDLTTIEHIAHEHYLAAALGIWENDYYQYERGFLPEDHWAKTYGNMVCDLSLPLYREIYLSGGWTYRTSFLSVIEKAMSDATSGPPVCFANSQGQ